MAYIVVFDTPQGLLPFTNDTGSLQVFRAAWEAGGAVRGHLLEPYAEIVTLDFYPGNL